MNSLSLCSLDDYDATSLRCVCPACPTACFSSSSHSSPGSSGPPAPSLGISDPPPPSLSSLKVWRLCCVYRLKLSLENKKWQQWTLRPLLKLQDTRHAKIARSIIIFLLWFRDFTVISLKKQPPIYMSRFESKGCRGKIAVHISM